MNKTESKIGFIGCGHMASAIIEGIIASGFVAKEHVMASEINPEFAKKKGVVPAAPMPYNGGARPPFNGQSSTQQQRPDRRF